MKFNNTLLAMVEADLDAFQFLIGIPALESSTEEISLENVEILLHDVIEMQAYNYTVNLYFFVSVVIFFVIYLLYRFINHFIDF